MKCLRASLFCLLVLASTARADGVGPLRRMTAAELSAFTSVRAAIQSALPAAPEGYALDFRYVSDCDEGTVPEGLKATDNFRMTYVARYTFDSRIREARQQAALMDRTRGTPEQQKRMAELMAREQELKKARDAASTRAEKDRIRADLKAIQARQNALTDEIAKELLASIASGGAAKAQQELDQSLPPKEYSIKVLVNGDLSLSDKAVPRSMEGSTLALEQGDGCEEFGNYCITLFIGPVEKVRKSSGYTWYQAPRSPRDAMTKASSIALTVGGPNDRADSVREFAGKIDMARLKSLLE